MFFIIKLQEICDCVWLIGKGMNPKWRAWFCKFDKLLGLIYKYEEMEPFLAKYERIRTF